MPLRGFSDDLIVKENKDLTEIWKISLWWQVFLQFFFFTKYEIERELNQQRVWKFFMVKHLTDYKRGLKTTTEYFSFSKFSRKVEVDFNFV